MGGLHQRQRQQAYPQNGKSTRTILVHNGRSPGGTVGHWLKGRIGSLPTRIPKVKKKKAKKDSTSSGAKERTEEETDEDEEGGPSTKRAKWYLNNYLYLF